MSVMNKADFVAKTQTLKNSDLAVDRSDWAGAAGSVLAAVALGHETLSKDEIVEAIQTLALRMPGELVAESTIRMMMVADKSGLL